MSYVGQTTKTLKERRKEYEYKINCVDFYFYRAMRKYGIDNFTWKIIKICRNKTELDWWEKYYIQKYKTKYPNGYNMTDGGEGTPNRIIRDETRYKLRIANLGKKASEETRKKLSESHMGKPNSHKGKKFSKEWKENLSKAHKGYKMPEEQKKKISESLRGRIVTENTRNKIRNSLVGRKQSEEVKLKRVKILRKIWNSKEYKRKMSVLITNWWAEKKGIQENIIV